MIVFIHTIGKFWVVLSQMYCSRPKTIAVSFQIHKGMTNGGRKDILSARGEEREHRCTLKAVYANECVLLSSETHS